MKVSFEIMKCGIFRNPFTFAVVTVGFSNHYSFLLAKQTLKPIGSRGHKSQARNKYYFVICAARGRAIRHLELGKSGSGKVYCTF